jgi:predicted HicB family RNase H-like nuclease
MNLMKVDGYHAKIEYGEETDQFRGDILCIYGGADFYSLNPDELRLEFKKLLDVFLEVCKEQGIEPRRKYS